MRLPQFGTVDEFVVWEERQPRDMNSLADKYRFFPGASARHEIIVVNLCLALRSVAKAHQVRGSGLKQLTGTSSRYPDVSVSFDARDAVHLRYARFPTLLLELLSPSTNDTDRGQKFDEHRTIETLREYPLVDSRNPWTQTARRSGDDWIVSLPLREGVLRFERVGLDLNFDDLYAGTEL
jgi:Uma2 family endonuclease